MLNIPKNYFQGSILATNPDTTDKTEISINNRSGLIHEDREMANVFEGIDGPDETDAQAAESIFKGLEMVNINQST